MNENELLLSEEHPTSRKHPRMSRMARAAQFAPFSALVGLEEELAERQRRVDGEEQEYNKNEGVLAFEDE